MTTLVPVLIVGAGISGLACAYALRRSGIDAQIVDAALRPGGLIRSERRDGFLLELGPQSFLGTPQLLDLCRDLSIEDQLLAAPPRAPRFLLINGKLRPAPLSPPAFFLSSLFAIGTKTRVLRDALGRSVPPADDESIAAFTRRKFSAELLDKLVGPFVSGIYAGDAEKLSLRAAFPQLHRAEESAGSLVRGMLRAAKLAKVAGAPKQRSTLQTFRDGNETLIAALAAKLGPALRTETTVTEIRHSGNDPGQYAVTLRSRDSQQQIIASRIVFATPANVTASLLRSLHADLAATFDFIEYAPVAVVSLGYAKPSIEHSLHGFGFLIPRSAKLRTLGTVWNSSLFPNRAPVGQVLLTSFFGGATDPQAVALSPEQLVSLAHREIAPVLGISEQPSFSNVTLYPHGLPQYNLGHTERLAALAKHRTQLPGVWLAGNFLHGPAIGTCVEEALSIADEIHARETVQADRSP